VKAPAETPLHFRSLDVLRGLASLAVVVFHYAGFLSLGDVTASAAQRSQLPFNGYLFPFYEQGWQAVTIFFSLSGFIFFWLYGTSVAERKISASEFFLLRFSRLYPLHFATLLLVAALQWLYARAHPDIPYFVCSVNDLEHFALQLFLASNWLPSSGFSFNFPVWSVSIEVLLYAVFFIFCRLQRPRPWTMGVLVLAGWWLIFRVHVDLGTGLGSFFAGGLVYMAYRRLAVISLQMPWLIALVSLTVLIWIVGVHGVANSWSFLPDSWSKRARYFPMALMFPSLILCLAMLEQKFRFPRGVAWLGDISYSTYLLHFPLQIAFVLVVDAAGLSRNVFYSPGVFIIYFATLILLGLASFHWLERPMQRRLRSLGRALRRPGVEGAMGPDRGDPSPAELPDPIRGGAAGSAGAPTSKTMSPP